MTDVGTRVGEYADDEIERSETGIRILLTLLFAVVAAAIETVLGIVVIFGLLWALITRQAPGTRVREFANRVITYYYRIGRYLTYNDSRVPFPFSEFPQALEGDAFDPNARESDALGLAGLDGPRLSDDFEDEEPGRGPS